MKAPTFLILATGSALVVALTLPSFAQNGAPIPPPPGAPGGAKVRGSREARAVVKAAVARIVRLPDRLRIGPTVTSILVRSPVRKACGKAMPERLSPPILPVAWIIPR